MRLGPMEYSAALYLAYVDDSGDENCDLLGAVMLPLDSWRECLKAWLNWRRFLFRRWGIPADFELHAVDFLRPKKIQFRLITAEVSECRRRGSTLNLGSGARSIDDLSMP